MADDGRAQLRQSINPRASRDASRRSFFLPRAFRIMLSRLIHPSIKRAQTCKPSMYKVHTKQICQRGWETCRNYSRESDAWWQKLEESKQVSEWSVCTSDDGRSAAPRENIFYFSSSSFFTQQRHACLRALLSVDGAIDRVAATTTAAADAHLPHFRIRPDARTRNNNSNRHKSSKRKTHKNAHTRANKQQHSTMGIGTRAKKWLSRLRGRSSKEEEVQQLQPVALAGASRKSSGRSTLCSSFATTVSSEELSASFRRSKAHSDGGGATAHDWKQCATCARNFLRHASKYKDFCSIDCKSLSLYRVSFT